MLTISDVDRDPRVDKVSRSLSSNGFEVVVLAPTDDGPEERDVAPGLRHVRVRREWLWRFFVVYQDEFRREGLRREYDFVHANDLTTLTVAWVLARVRGARLIYDAHELWTDNVQPVADGWVPMSEVTRIVATAWERFLLRSVDLIVTVSPSIAAELARRSGREPLLVPNYPSLALRDVAQRERSLREECGVSESQFLTLYMGGINPLRNIENVIRAHRHLPEHYVFAVRGPGIDVYGPDYEELARAEGVADRVRLLAPVAMDEVVVAAAGADCGIVMLRNICRNFYFFFPNKLFEYALAGVPVAASDFPDVRAFVRGERCGVTFDPESPASIADALRRLGEDRGEARSMGERGRASIVRERNWESAVEQLLSAYDRLAAAPTAA